MNLTAHAKVRRAQRNISLATIEAVLTHGRVIYGRKAEVMFVGRSEVRRAHSRGIDLHHAVNVQVVVSHDGRVVTTYRTNRPFRSWCRPRRRH